VCSLWTLRSDPNYSLVAMLDGSMSLYDLRTQRAVRQLEPNRNSVHMLRLELDDRESLVAQPGSDGMVRVWDLQSGDVVFQSQQRHSNKVMRGVALSSAWPRLPRSALVDDLECYFSDEFSGASSEMLRDSESHRCESYAYRLGYWSVDGPQRYRYCSILE